jgi:delta24(24(1))-sterol reductase
LSLIALQLLLAITMPGVQQQGLPVSSLGGRTLVYNCNAYTSLYATIAIVAFAHFQGYFNLADIIDLYGPLLTIANISGFVLAAVVYVTGEGYRMSGNLIYDYFMGSSLNPRIGSVDIKMWAEIRISWILLWALAMGGVAKQYETYGYVSANLILYAYGTGLYLNACAKVSPSPCCSQVEADSSTLSRGSNLFHRPGVRAPRISHWVGTDLSMLQI